MNKKKAANIVEITERIMAPGLVDLQKRPAGTDPSNDGRIRETLPEDVLRRKILELFHEPGNQGLKTQEVSRKLN